MIKAKYPVDLHCHSNYSDGIYSIDELLNLAVNSGIKSLALTDHDTTAGLSHCEVIGKAYDIDVIPGVEISAFDYKRKRKAHILGLFLDPGDESINELCRSVLAERQAASFKSVKIINAEGYKIDWDELVNFSKPSPVVYKQQIMHFLVKKGYTSEVNGTLYSYLFNSTNGIAYFPIKYIDVSAAVKTVVDCGGTAVLAHPGLYGNEQLIPELIDSGLSGIEARHPGHSINLESGLIKTAEKYDLFITGGSDFHNDSGKNPPGISGITSEELVKILFTVKNQTLSSNRSGVLNVQ